MRNQRLCMAEINTTVCRLHAESSSKMWQIHPPPVSPFTSTHPHPEPAQPPTTTTTTQSPPLPWAPLQPAACLWRSPLTSAARLGRVPTLWALDGCGWSEKQSTVCGAHGTDSTRPAQTHLMARKHPTGPFPLPFCCLSHTLAIKGDICEDEWFVLQMAGIINTSRRGILCLGSGYPLVFKRKVFVFQCKKKTNDWRDCRYSGQQVFVVDSYGIMWAKKYKHLTKAKYYRNYNSASIYWNPLIHSICHSDPENCSVCPCVCVCACEGEWMYLQACCWSSSSAIYLTSLHSHSPKQSHPASVGAARGRPSLSHLSSLKSTETRHILVYTLHNFIRD